MAGQQCCPLLMEETVQQPQAGTGWHLHRACWAPHEAAHPTWLCRSAPPSRVPQHSRTASRPCTWAT